MGNIVISFTISDPGRKRKHIDHAIIIFSNQIFAVTIGYSAKSLIERLYFSFKGLFAVNKKSRELDEITVCISMFGLAALVSRQDKTKINITTEDYPSNNFPLYFPELQGYIRCCKKCISWNCPKTLEQPLQSQLFWQSWRSFPF